MFFKTKDSKEPVECQIRPMVNGMPSADIFLASVHVKPADVQLPSAQTQLRYKHKHLQHLNSLNQFIFQVDKITV